MNAPDTPIYTAVIYNRVSHAQRSISVEDQDRENRTVCESNDWPVRRTFCDDGISASRYGKTRPGWEQLKSELRQGDVLVVWDSSRAQRDLAEFVELRTLCEVLNVPLSYSGRILNLSEGNDRFIGGIDALVAERFSEQLTHSVRRGKTSAAAAGHPSTNAPWGFRALPRPSPKTPPRWEHDPVEAPRVREAVERLLEGHTLCSVMRWIEATDGFTPSSLTNLKRSLTNPALAGLRVHQGQVVGPGTWKKIINKTQHHKLLDQLAGAPAPSRGREPKYLLTGIAKCGLCGDGLRWKVYKGNRGPRYRYECYRGHCSREAKAIEAAVTDKLFRLIPVVAAAAPPTMMPRTEDTERKTKALERTVEEWRQAAIKGDVTPASFATIEKGLLSQIEQLRPKAPPKFRLPDSDNIAEAWEGWSVRERRDQIRLLLDITVMPAEPRGTGQLLIEPGGELGITLRSRAAQEGTVR